MKNFFIPKMNGMDSNTPEMKLKRDERLLKEEEKQIEMEGCGYVSIYIKEELPEDETPHYDVSGESEPVVEDEQSHQNDDNEMGFMSESEVEEPLCLESDRFVPIKEEPASPLDDGYDEMYSTAETEETTLHSHSDTSCASNKSSENVDHQPNTSSHMDEWKLIAADWSEDSGKKDETYTQGWSEELSNATSEDLCEESRGMGQNDVDNYQRITQISESNSESTDGITADLNRQQHQCSECDKSFSLRSNLIAHMTTHTSKKAFACSQCDKSFSFESYLTKHMGSHSGEKDKYECPECNRVYANKSYFVFHMNSHILDKHSQSKEGCDEGADKPFFLYEMSSRIQPKHHPCPECGKSFSRKALLIAHLRSHSGEKPFKCSECEKAYSCKSHLTSHMRIHSGERPYECSECDKTFTDKSFLVSHMRVHTGVKPYQCPQCDKAFGTRNNLTHHIRIHTGEKPYSCSVCNKAFARNTNLTQHMRIHTGERPYPCPYCDMRFSWKPNLDKHMFLHSGEKPFECEVCGKKCARKANLAVHMRVHTKAKPFKCPVCDKGFGYESVLTVHLRTHTGEKPYKCSECGKQFAHKSRLKEHMTVHSGEKPYPCLKCDEKFVRKAQLCQHMKTHHAAENHLPSAGSDLKSSLTSQVIANTGVDTTELPLDASEHGEGNDHETPSIAHTGNEPGKSYKTIKKDHHDLNELHKFRDKINKNSEKVSNFTAEGWCAADASKP